MTDLQQRAKSYAKSISKNDTYQGYLERAYIAGATEERELGKRFNHWTRLNGYEYSTIFQFFANDNDYTKQWTYKQLFDKFLEEESLKLEVDGTNN